MISCADTLSDLTLQRFDATCVGSHFFTTTETEVDFFYGQSKAGARRTSTAQKPVKSFVVGELNICDANPTQILYLRTQIQPRYPFPSSLQ